MMEKQLDLDSSAQYSRRIKSQVVHIEEVSTESTVKEPI